MSKMSMRDQVQALRLELRSLSKLWVGLARRVEALEENLEKVAGLVTPVGYTLEDVVSTGGERNEMPKGRLSTDSGADESA